MMMMMFTRMFDAVAKKYDVVNKYMTLGWDMEWRSTLVSSLKVREGEERKIVGAHS